MKRVAQILMTVVTGIFAISVVTALGYLFVSFLLELVPFIFSIFYEAIENWVSNIIVERYGESAEVVEIINNVTTIINIVGSVGGFIIFTINFVFSLFLNLLDAGILAVFIVATVKAWKAKSKKDLIFPAVLCIIYGAIYFMSQSYLHAALGIAPGVMFLVVSDKEFENKKPLEKAKIEEKKEETPVIEPEVLEGAK